jgi:hypothetical protein
MSRPIGVDKARAAEKQQMSDTQSTADHEMNRNCRWSEADNARPAEAARPQRTPNAAPPTPQDETIQQ